MTPSPPRRVVVVGASLAGISAVDTARRSGFAGELVLIGDEPYPPYDRPPLSKEYLWDSAAATSLFYDRESLAALDVDLRIGQPATGVDLAARTVTVGAEAISYDALLLATGQRARTLPGRTPGAVHTLRTLDDATRIRTGMEQARSLVVIGAGFIGSEVASAAVRRGLSTTILEASEAPLVHAVGVEAGRALTAIHERHGVEVRAGVSVAGLVGDDRVEAVRLADGTEVPADLVVVGIGARPALEWLAGSGLDLDDGIVCDPTLRAAENVWAAGDITRWDNQVMGRVMRVEHWTNAREQGEHAMTSLLDPEQATPYRHVPYVWSDWYGDRIQFAGVPAGEPQLVDGSWSGDRFVALYRQDDRLVGALTLNRRGDIMKYRRLIGAGGSFDQGLDLAAERRRAPAPRGHRIIGSS